MLNYLMPYLNDTDLDREIQRLRLALPELARQINELTQLRDARTTKRVARLLPRISRRVLQNLHHHHPDFLTPDRLGLFKAHLPAFGWVPRKGHDQALTLLQAQFKAHLVESGQDSAEQWVLRSLAIRHNDTLRELLEALAEQRQRAAGPRQSPADFRQTAEGYSAIAGRPDDDDSALGWAMTQTMMMQAAMDPTPGHATRPETSGEKAECIATDDSLGCFS